MLDGIGKQNTLNYQSYSYTKPYQQVNATKEVESAIYEMMSQEDGWHQYHYKEEKNDIVHKADWEAYQANYMTDDEKIAELYQEGYGVEMMTYNQMLYAQSFSMSQETSKSSDVVVQSYEPIEEKIDRIKEEHDSMYKYAMSEGTISINTLYRASYMEQPSSNKGIQAFVKEDVEKVLGYNGLENNKSNQFAVEKLMNLGVDVTKDSVLKYQNLVSTVQTLSKQEETKKAVKDVEDGKEPGNTPLMEEEKILYSDMTISEVADKLKEIREEDIEGVIEDGEEMTIGHLKERMFKNTKKVLDGKEGTEKQSEGMSQYKEQVDVVKEQIREIRAKLTTESAIRLSEKMPLESTELAKVAEELRHIQGQIAEEALMRADVPVTEETKAQMIGVMETTVKVQEYPTVALGMIYQGTKELALTKGEISLEGVHQALLSYEASGTVPELRFGETASKLQDQIKVFLEQENLPQTSEMIESAKALISNGMPLTIEHLEGTKETLLKVNTLLATFTPDSAASYIKEGMNPYKASINQILDWVGTKAFPEMTDTVAGAIVTLEEKGMINTDQKQSLIGIYRILQGVQTSKEQVVGYLFKNEQELTLEKLNEAIQYSKSGRAQMNQVIDDGFGELKQLTYQGETAKQLLSEGTLKSEERLEVARQLENMELPITEDNITRYNQVRAAIYPYIRQTLKDTLGKYESVDLLPDSVKEKIEGLKDVKQEVIGFMEEKKIPMTLSNIYWVQKMHDEPELYSQMVAESDVFDRSLPETFEELERDSALAKEEAAEQKYEAMSQGDPSAYRSYKQLEEMIQVQKQLEEKEGLYQIPFVINGEQKMVNLYINKRENKNKVEGKESIEAIISYDTKTLGNTKAYLTISDQTISYKVVGENEKATKALEKQAKALKEMLEKIGYGISQTTYETDHIKEEVTKPITLGMKGDSAFEAVI